MILVKKPTVNRKSSKGNYSNGLTINNLNKFVVRYFEDQALSGLKPNSDKTVINPSLKAGVSGYTPYWGFSPDGTTTRSCLCYLLSIPYGVFCVFKPFCNRNATRWCNGNTRDFGSLIGGSSPPRVAIIFYRQWRSLFNFAFFIECHE